VSKFFIPVDIGGEINMSRFFLQKVVVFMRFSAIIESIVVQSLFVVHERPKNKPHNPQEEGVRFFFEHNGCRPVYIFIHRHFII